MVRSLNDAALVAAADAAYNVCLQAHIAWITNKSSKVLETKYKAAKNAYDAAINDLYTHGLYGSKK